ncbi:TPA: hypothetical protein ACIRLG_000818 [Streptococcus suis]
MILVAIAFSSSGLIPVSLLAICTKISASEVTCSSVFLTASSDELSLVDVEFSAVSELAPVSCDDSEVERLSELELNSLVDD